jgi:hypothetical protein
MTGQVVSLIFMFLFVSEDRQMVTASYEQQGSGNISFGTLNMEQCTRIISPKFRFGQN